MNAPVTAIVLGGDRGGPDALCAATGAAGKALVPLCGTPLLSRVVRTVDGADHVAERWLAGPPEAVLRTRPALLAELNRRGWRHVPPGATPATSAYETLAVCSSTTPVLITTADHGLLSVDIINEFVDNSLDSGADLCIGFVRHDRVVAAYPETRRTGWPFRDGRFCGCNLYLVNGPRGTAVVELWRRFERHRKHPWRIVAMVGPGVLARFACRRLTLAQGLDALARPAGASIRAILLDDPRAGVDIDTPADLALATRILGDSPC